MSDSRALSGLLQLGSASLPVGAFSHSLGLESAHAARLLPDAAAVERWVDDLMRLSWARSEAPLWLAQFKAWQTIDAEALQQTNAQLIALRDTAEFRLESEQTARSLRRWLQGLAEEAQPNPLQKPLLDQLQPLAFASVHALAAQRLGLDSALGLHALGWSLLENLVMAAVKLLPLGQSGGQSLLRKLALQLPSWIDMAESFTPLTTSSFTPMLSILSANHETQYSRLFRS